MPQADAGYSPAVAAVHPFAGCDPTTKLHRLGIQHCGFMLADMIEELAVALERRETLMDTITSMSGDLHAVADNLHHWGFDPRLLAQLRGMAWRVGTPEALALLVRSTMPAMHELAVGIEAAIETAERQRETLAYMELCDRPGFMGTARRIHCTWMSWREGLIDWQDCRDLIGAELRRLGRHVAGMRHVG